jgi:peptide/nickel transport system substrate-binding protein
MGLVACSTPTAPFASGAQSSGQAPAGNSSAAAQNSAKPAAQPKTGGTIKIAREGDASGYVPWGVSSSKGVTTNLGYERLVRRDEKLNVENWLAEKIDVSPDFKEVKISLRKGVTFHSGRELDSEDVVYNLIKVRDPIAGSTQVAEMSKWFNRQETPDKNTVILRADAPRTAVFDLLDYLVISDRVTMEQPGGDAKVVGTGPWILTERKEGVVWRFLKNKNYWRTGRPYLDEVRIDLMADPQAKLVNFESGASDIVDAPNLRDLTRMEKEGKYNITSFPGFVYLLAFNTTKPPFDNKLARQALNYAVDRKRILDTVLAGKGEIKTLPWSSSSEAHDPALVNAFPFDLDKAKSLLNQAGVTSDEIDIISNAPINEVTAMGPIIQADFAKIGLRANLKPMETPAWTDVGNKREFRGIDAALTSWISISPASLPFTSSYFRASGNKMGWDNADYKRLAETMGAEPDAAKRKVLFNELNKLFHDEAPIVFVASANSYLGAQANVNDYRRDNNYGLALHDTWLG